MHPNQNLTDVIENLDTNNDTEFYISELFWQINRIYEAKVSILKQLHFQQTQLSRLQTKEEIDELEVIELSILLPIIKELEREIKQIINRYTDKLAEFLETKENDPKFLLWSMRSWVSEEKRQKLYENVEK